MRAEPGPRLAGLHQPRDAHHPRGAPHHRCEPAPLALDLVAPIDVGVDPLDVDRPRQDLRRLRHGDLHAVVASEWHRHGAAPRGRVHRFADRGAVDSWLTGRRGIGHPGSAGVEVDMRGPRPPSCAAAQIAIGPPAQRVPTAGQGVAVSAPRITARAGGTPGSAASSRGKAPLAAPPLAS